MERSEQAGKVQKAKPAIMPRLLNEDQAAEYLNISLVSFRRLLKDGLFPMRRLGGLTLRRFDIRDLDKTIDNIEPTYLGNRRNGK